MVGAHLQGFGGADHVDSQQHVIADFCQLAGTVVPGTKHLSAHAFQHRAGTIDGIFRAATDKGERASLGPANAAGDRRIDHYPALLPGNGGHVTGGVGIDGGAVDNQGAFINVRQHTLLSQVQTTNRTR